MTHKALIMARNRDKVISVDGMLPWHCPDDLASFKKITMEYDFLLMGRKTYESIPHLPNRKLAVLSRDSVYHQTLLKANSTVTFIDESTAHEIMESPRRCIVIGGAEVANLLMPYYDDVYLTTIFQPLVSDVSHLEVKKFDFNPYRDFSLYCGIRFKDCKVEHFRRR